MQLMRLVNVCVYELIVYFNNLIGGEESNEETGDGRE